MIKTGIANDQWAANGCHRIHEYELPEVSGKLGDIIEVTTRPTLLCVPVALGHVCPEALRQKPLATFSQALTAALLMLEYWRGVSSAISVMRPCANNWAALATLFTSADHGTGGAGV